MGPGRVVTSRAQDTDEQLALAAQAGDAQAMRDLISAWTGFARFQTGVFFIAGGDRDDVIQEGLIGLWKAVRDWQPDLGRFDSFAKLCVTRHIITAVKLGTRVKNRQLTHAIRVGVMEEESRELVDVVDTVEDLRADVVQLVIDRADVAVLVRVVNEELTPAERVALIGIANGLSHAEIFELLGRPSTSRLSDGRQRPKSSENAYDRAVRKLRVALEVDQRPLGVAA